MAFLFALASALLYGTADFFGGIAARRAPLLAVPLLVRAPGRPVGDGCAIHGVCSLQPPPSTL